MGMPSKDVHVFLHLLENTWMISISILPSKCLKSKSLKKSQFLPKIERIMQEIQGNKAVNFLTSKVRQQEFILLFLILGK